MKTRVLLWIAFFFSGMLTAQQLETVYPDDFVGSVAHIQMHETGIGYAPLECGYLLRTEDGGENWETFSLPVMQQSSFPFTYFLDEEDPSKVIFHSIREILYTEDGFTTSTNITPSAGGLINGFVQLESGRWLISGTQVLYSDDQGQSWTPSATAEAGGRGLLYHQGILYTGSRGIYRSTDDGETFTKVLNEDINLRKIIGQGNRLYAIALDKSIYESTDNGLSWEKISTQNFFGLPQGLTFYDDNTLLTYTGTSLTYSTDGGRNWENEFLFIDGPASALHVNGDGQIFVGSTGSQIYNSDGLSDIFSQRHGYGEDFSCIAANGNRVVAVGEGGALAFSADSGATWSFDIVGDFNLSFVTFIDDQPVIANDLGQILRLLPDLSFEVVFETNSGVESIVYSQADGLAYIVAGNTIYKSLDKGESWFEHYTFPSPPSRLKADFAGNLFVLVEGQIWNAFNASNNFELYTEGPAGASNVFDFLVLRFNTIYILTLRDMYLSLDRGETFSQSNSPYNGKRLHAISQDRVACLGTNGSDADLFIAEKGILDFDVVLPSCAALARDAYWDESTETFWVCGKGREIQKADLENPTTSLPSAVPQPQLAIYPNPTADYLQIAGATVGPTHWQVFNIIGQPVKDEKGAHLYVGDLLPGPYFLRLDGQHSLRFIKQ